MEDLMSLYYRKYKQYFIPISIIFVSIFAIFRIALPQVDEIKNVDDKIEKKKEEVSALAKSLQELNNLTETNLDENIKTIEQALPTSKDFLTIYLGIFSASTKSGTSLKSFSSEVGNIYQAKVIDPVTGKEILVTPGVQTLNKSVSTPVIVVKTEIEAAGIDQFESFTKEVANILPLADIDKMDFNGTTGSFDLKFFYSELNPEKLAAQTKIEGLTLKEKDLLEDLKSKKSP